MARPWARVEDGVLYVGRGDDAGQPRARTWDEAQRLLRAIRAGQITA